jgi:hypothetical protein
MPDHPQASNWLSFVPGHGDLSRVAFGAIDAEA